MQACMSMHLPNEASKHIQIVPLVLQQGKQAKQSEHTLNAIKHHLLQGRMAIFSPPVYGA